MFVTINYRLGAFGWLSGPEFQASGGIANAGLHDQRLALEWVQKNIHLFGGDPNRVTIMGSSAGASSVLHQITVGTSISHRHNPQLTSETGIRRKEKPWTFRTSYFGVAWFRPNAICNSAAEDL